MKNIINFLLITLLIFLPLDFLYARDKVVAIVNKEIITQKDLNDFFNFIRLQYAQQLNGKALEDKVNSMKPDLLKRLIEDKIMLQKAKDEKIIIDPERVKAKINEIKKRYTKESNFERDLAAQGLVQADLENKIREQMLTYYVIDQKVRNKILLSPDEVSSYYNQNKSQFSKPEERILSIVILQDEGMAKTVSYQLRLGTKIEDLVGKYVFTTDILSVSRGQELRSEIEDTVFKLGIGEISNPVKVGEQYYIFKLDNIVASRQMDLAGAQERIQAFLFEKKLQVALARWLDELKLQSYIKILEN